MPEYIRTERAMIKATYKCWHDKVVKGNSDSVLCNNPKINLELMHVLDAATKAVAGKNNG